MSLDRPELRVADMHALFQDDEVDVVHCLWGGVGAIEMLPLIDYDLIAAHPKALMGYSDITNLHAALLKNSGLATFQGPASDPSARQTAGRSRSTLRSRRSPKGEWAVPKKPDDDWIRLHHSGESHRADRRWQPLHAQPPHRHAVAARP